MPTLDFTEIAVAHAGAGRDDFELFARDFLEAQGFEILVGPDRGPDAGRDLVVRELREGPGGQTELHWLVSCKHKAASGSAVGHAEEQNMRDRMETHGCMGFIAFYSTVPSSTLATHLQALAPTYSLLIYDKEAIEQRLLDSPKGRSLAARYMRRSFQRWIISSQYAATPSAPQPLPSHDRFFLREPHSNLQTALVEAKARGVMLLAVIFDEAHPSRSRLHYGLGYFMEWESTKRLVDEHFVCVLGPSSDVDLGGLVPEDDPLEESRIVIMDGDRNIIRSESVYANPTEGRNRVRAAIAANQNRT